MITMTITDARAIPAIGHDEAMRITQVEFDRMLGTMRELDADDWSRPTDNTEWNVREMLLHLLGAADANASMREMVRQMVRGKRLFDDIGGDHWVDGINEIQIRDRATLPNAEVVERYAAVIPKAVRARTGLPRPIAALPVLPIGEPFGRPPATGETASRSTPSTSFASSAGGATTPRSRPLRSRSSPPRPDRTDRPTRKGVTMETTTTEIADGIHRISTFLDPGMHFNQYLVVADEPLLFHTGHRQLFPQVSEAVGRIIPAESLRWITFGHVEADECGSMNEWLAAAPQAQVAHGGTAVLVSLNDLADRPPRILADGEVLDLGGKRVRYVDTPHVPHSWEAGLLFEETTSTLFCGDLFTAVGECAPTTDDDILGPALAAEEMFHATALTPSTGPTIRGLVDLDPKTLALMHGPAFTGDTKEALLGLAAAYQSRLADALHATV